jgi:hypothetical protein
MQQENNKMPLHLYFQEVLVAYGLEEADLVVVDDNPQVHPTQRLKLSASNVYFESSFSSLNDSNSEHLFHNPCHSNSSVLSPQNQKWSKMDSVVGFANTTKNRWGHQSAASNSNSVSTELMGSSASISNTNYSADSRLNPPARRTSTEIDRLISPSLSPSADSSLALPARRTSPDSPFQRIKSGSSLSHNQPDRLISMTASPFADSSPAYPARRTSVDNRSHPPPFRRIHSTASASTPTSASENSDRLITPPARRSSCDTFSMSFVPDLGDDDEKQEDDNDKDETSIPGIVDNEEVSDTYESDNDDCEKCDKSGSDEEDDGGYSVVMALSSATDDDVDDSTVATFDAAPPVTPQVSMINLRKSIPSPPKPTTTTITIPSVATVDATPPVTPRGPMINLRKSILSSPKPTTTTITIPEGSIPDALTTSTPFSSPIHPQSPRRLPKHTNSFELNKRKCSRRGAIVLRSSVIVAALEASLTALDFSDTEHDHEGGDNKDSNNEEEEDSEYNDHTCSVTRGTSKKEAARDQADVDEYEESSGLKNLSPSQLERMRLFQEALRAVDEDQTSKRLVGTQMVAERELIIDL